MRRAECARQSFHESVASPSADFSTLTGAEKYYQRLRNNRRSAAASKLYRKVISRELTTLLRRTSPENRDNLAKAITVYAERCSEVEDHINHLRSIPLAEKEKYEVTKALNIFERNEKTDSHHQEMCKDHEISIEGCNSSDFLAEMPTSESRHVNSRPEIRQDDVEAEVPQQRQGLPQFCAQTQLPHLNDSENGDVFVDNYVCRPLLPNATKHED